eukprot:CAMPEP_0179370356 /NCGR_PEP_ID=MMETSP0797-20121207/85142_1 /TAXON_ID=47934 /ORGANISM="Dinophysis acuminata, Strain DAEP01" /LENGTH=35 /DNA_ID= /DNA_START= /DNA_END= /DNA_ORIENTATION=
MAAGRRRVDDAPKCLLDSWREQDKLCWDEVCVQGK